MRWRSCPRLFSHIPSRPPTTTPAPASAPSLLSLVLSLILFSLLPLLRRSATTPLAPPPLLQPRPRHPLTFHSLPVVLLTTTRGSWGASRVSPRTSCARRRGGAPLAVACSHEHTSSPLLQHPLSPLSEPPHSLPFHPLQRRFAAAVVELNLLEWLGIDSSSPGVDRASSVLDLASLGTYQASALVPHPRAQIEHRRALIWRLQAQIELCHVLHIYFFPSLGLQFHGKLICCLYLGHHKWEWGVDGWTRCRLIYAPSEVLGILGIIVPTNTISECTRW
jgi:hypothetical protein